MPDGSSRVPLRNRSLISEKFCRVPLLTIGTRCDDLLKPLKPLVPSVLMEVLPQLAEPVEDAGGYRGFHAGAVTLKLVNDDRRNQQLHLPLTRQDPQRHDPSLAVTSLGQIEPHRGVDE